MATSIPLDTIPPIMQVLNISSLVPTQFVLISIDVEHLFFDGIVPYLFHILVVHLDNKNESR